MKNRRKISKPLHIILCFLLSLCVICGIFVIGINAYMLVYADKYIISKDDLKSDNYDCVLILGAGLWDGEPSPMLRERLKFGIEAYNTGCTDRILMSGDHGRNEYDEVNTMKKAAVSEGIPADRVFLDHAGFSTYESMYRAKAVFNVKKAVIVTQRYHLYRAVYDARKLGIEAYGFPAEELSYPIGNNIREVAARVKDWLWCIKQPEPTYLGEKIPIEANASASDDRVYE